MRNALIISEKKPRGDLTERTKEVLNKDGEHVLYEDDSGRRLVVEVANGRMVDWSAFKDDTEVPTVIFKDIEPPATVGEVTSLKCIPSYRVVCACFEGADDVCWYVRLR